MKDKVESKAVKEALEQYKKYADVCQRNDYMIVVDYTLPSSTKRLYIVDLTSREVVNEYYCAHGIGSSDPDNPAMAIEFSNKPGSHKSSLGAMVTSDVYRGKHGFSLRLNGLERCNDQVRRRCIVIHGAEYCDEDWVKRNKRCGRSHGCPAVGTNYSGEIVQTYKGGCFYYAYYK